MYADIKNKNCVTRTKVLFLLLYLDYVFALRESNINISIW